MGDTQVFFEAEWTHRNWRSFVLIPVSGFLSLFPLTVATRALIVQKDLLEHYNWVPAIFILLFGAFWLWIFATLVARIIQGKVEHSRIDVQGIKVAKEFWRWDQLRFIRPTKDATGGILLLIALKGNTDRYFWIGRPLNSAEYDKVRENLFPFLVKHHPQLLE